ncbi:MAG: hypothetical protein JSR91_00925 [Proteobacteria bacterium]|nr:hypothetical protein [Pseudomonadota bacterium]
MRAAGTPAEGDLNRSDAGERLLEWDYLFLCGPNGLSTIGTAGGGIKINTISPMNSDAQTTAMMIK